MSAKPSDAALPATHAAEWWRGGAIYQIYPRSFLDTDADGIGDLNGIEAKLDYIESLGIDAIWISPFFKSPMADFGYDVADYCDVDPQFGTLADFDQLVEQAHARGVRVMIDLVFAHTSDQHAWFAESRASRDNPKADWYVWGDAREDGTPPSNWQSVFGGPAWTWDARRCQYYMHQFLKEQPQLNVHNPEVQDALLGVVRFWLERGVDGFRLDALNHAMHDPQLRDNPPAPADGKPRTRPFDFQLRTYSQSHPDIVHFIDRIGALCAEFGVIHTVAEVGGPDAEREMKAFTAGSGRLSTAYGFDFLYADKLTPALVAKAMAAWPGGKRGGLTEGWPSWAFENHDAPRAVSRWCAPEDRDAFARMKMLLLASLRGNIIIYQGEELGLRQVEIPFEQLRDPEAIANWPLTLTRDGARTPFPWSAGAPNAGFTAGEPWLQVGEDNNALAVDRQEGEPDSLLTLTRKVLALRNAHGALRLGKFELLEAGETVLAFRRTHVGAGLTCAFNLSAEAQEWPARVAGEVLMSVNGAAPGALPAYGGAVLRG